MIVLALQRVREAVDRPKRASYPSWKVIKRADADHWVDEELMNGFYSGRMPHLHSIFIKREYRKKRRLKGKTAGTGGEAACGC